MKILPRLLLPTLLLGAPWRSRKAPRPPRPPRAPARTIDVSFRGSLRDALKTIAEKGGLNLVVTGDLDTPAEVRLRGITAEQALRTVARAYSLHLEQDGSIFTLRPLTAKEKESGASPTANAPTPPVAPPVAAATPPAPPAPPDRPPGRGRDAGGGLARRARRPVKRRGAPATRPSRPRRKRPRPPSSASARRSRASATASSTRRASAAPGTWWRADRTWR